MNLPSPNSDLLQEALDWCALYSLGFDYVNANAPERTAAYGSDSRKLSADLYLDDRSLLNPLESWTLDLIDIRLHCLQPDDIVAVDFDGTLCTNAWPRIGEPNTHLIRMLLAAQQRGVRLTLWTCREHPQTAWPSDAPGFGDFLPHEPPPKHWRDYDSALKPIEEQP